MAWIWVAVGTARAIHDELLAEHGGPSGIRDEGLLESALARPRHADAYGSPSVAELAAAYGYGIASNHPFLDGNKRTSLVVTELFLALNGFEVTASDAECVLVWENLAAGRLTERELAAWIGDHLAALRK